MLIPGVVECQSGYIEHPELIAQRIGRYAHLVGRDNVMAGVDCGFSIHAGSGGVDPDVVWAKMAALAKGAAPASPMGSATNDDILEDIFLESPALLEGAKDLTDACERMLTLAMQKMTCEHGAVFLRENPGKPLICAAAAGALANAISRIELSSSTGLASVSLQTGVSLSVTNPSTDARYTPDFARAGVQERSMLLASVHDESTYGVILLFNRNQPNGFSTVDASALADVGQQLGGYIQSLIDAQ
jgi:hypothetical protein